jgi:tRNA (cmo5U34)-methyltransferase
VAQFHFTPDRYDEWIREDVPVYEELQQELARATAGVEAARVLDLGVGTGETARHVLRLHPAARVTGIDASADMLERARADLPRAAVEALAVSRLQDPLPRGPFDLVVSALAVHHLDGSGKADLFRRVANVLRPGGRFVLADVVVPETPEDAVTPTTPGYDLPDRVDDLVGWLSDAAFVARLVWSHKDLAVLAADRR